MELQPGHVQAVQGSESCCWRLWTEEDHAQGPLPGALVLLALLSKEE